MPKVNVPINMSKTTAAPSDKGTYNWCKLLTSGAKRKLNRKANVTGTKKSLPSFKAYSTNRRKIPDRVKERTWTGLRNLPTSRTLGRLSSARSVASDDLGDSFRFGRLIDRRKDLLVSRVR